ncbi:PREDICTED: protein FAM114A2-like isoform X1 [Amphimedon queenslandica]|uniref:Protein FAM114A2 n=1 Tax=Amphimedon queenslandica TaxID=400682 RepID=A0A1X7UE29_AMPQE|nr:PREDICTED: protein FAM114A2-like isoform X1 [Amphimedon queenslandica]|eukprot:XP_019854949.1 PREDICTED: protein FAM114A2-like isoform X1 [Amphimedon queenslandica]
MEENKVESEEEFESAESDSEGKVLEEQSNNKLINNKQTMNTDQASDTNTSQSDAKQTHTEEAHTDTTQTHTEPAMSNAEPTDTDTSTNQSHTGTSQSDPGTNQSHAGTNQSHTGTSQSDPGTNQSNTGTSQSDPGTNQSNTGTNQSDTGTSQSGTSSWSWGWGSITSTLSSAVTKATEYTSSVINKGGEEEEEVPTPQEMRRESTTDEEREDQSIGGIFTGLATAVQSTGASLLSGGLDALEVIGRKTVDIISEGDPGLRKKRALLTGDTKTLSQLLKEAKETNNDNNNDDNNQENTSSLINYSQLIEQHGGLVHLEALEMLSGDCTSKLESIESESVNDEVQSLCQYFNIEEEEEEDPGDGKEFTNISSLTIDRVKADQLIKCHEDINIQAKEEVDKDIEVLYVESMNGMARLCSSSLQLFKKTSEILLIPSDGESIDVKDVAMKLKKITVIISNEFETIASLYAEKINEKSSEDKGQEYITSLYLEASSSSSYVQSAHKLLLPVLQHRLTITINNNNN